MLRALDHKYSSHIPPADADHVELKKTIGILRRRWPVLALTLGLGLACTQVLLSYIIPIYSASVQLMIDTRKQAIERDAALSGLSLETGAIESEVALMRSFEIARRVVRSLHLDKDPTFLADPPSVWSVFLSEIWPPRSTLQPNSAPLSDARRDTALPGAAQTEAAQAGAAPADNAPSGAPPSSTAPQATLQPNSAPLSDARRDTALPGAAQTEAAQAGAAPADNAPSGALPSSTAPSGPAESMAVDRRALQAIQKVRDSTQVRRVGLTYTIEITYSSPDPFKAAEIANALAQGYLAEQLEAQVSAARRAADWLSERLVGLRENMEQSSGAVAQYKREHQMLETNSGGIQMKQLSDLSVQLMQARINTMEKKARYEQLRGAGESGGYNLKYEYEVALRRQEELEKTFEQAADKQERLEEASVRLRDLEREAESNSLIYQSFLQRFKEASENKSLERRESRVITPAEIPSSPSYPHRRIFFFAAVSLSLIVGGSISMLIETLKNGFLTAEEIENRLHCPVIATIRTVTNKELTHRGEVLSLPDYIAAKPTSQTGEALCAIRVGLQLYEAKGSPCVVLFASSVTGEGKSVLAHSFACSATVAGQRVALIDADLRHPSMSKALGIADECGLYEYLLGSEPIDKIAKSLRDGKLLLMPAGKGSGSSADLLGSEKMRDLVVRLKENYDFVVIDTPPLASVIDATVLAKLVDKIVYVIEWEKVPREVVARAIDKLGVDRDKIAGAILNKANIRKMSRYLPYYSYYSSRKYKKYYDGAA